MADLLRVLFLGERQAELVAAELRRGGYEPSIRCACSKGDLDRALDANSDIAICNSVSGDCGALAVLRAIQERGLDLPVIVVSGKIKNSEIVAALSAGAADHLTRGSLMRLNAAVARELRAAKMRRDRLRLEEQFRHAQKMEAVGRLAAGVAHDFNNLLTIITGYSDLLLSRRAMDESERSGLDEIRRAAERGGALTYQLLAFSRRQPLEVRTISLNELLLQMERMVRRVIGEDIDLVTLPAASPDTVECDPGRLDQVILNLVVNARDAMPNGGKLIVETGNIQVAKSPSAEPVGVPPGRYVTLSVTDNGVGMDAETRSHLFEPFFTTKHPGRGTGLGLATAYGMIHQIGGDIGVSSEPGRGTAVQIYLPLAKDKGKAPKGKPAPVAKLAGAETILVVEDDARVRKLIAGVLRGRGYTVVEAAAGEEAIRRAKEHKGTVHLAVVDVVMPEMSGPDLIRQIAPLFPGMRVLYISGYTDEALEHHRIPESGESFLQKPFLPDALAKKVREILERKISVDG
jgi:signal transduction histidine kinase/ActR/RegA family two-component response regulator